MLKSIKTWRLKMQDKDEFLIGLSCLIWFIFYEITLVITGMGLMPSFLQPGIYIIPFVLLGLWFIFIFC